MAHSMAAVISVGAVLVEELPDAPLAQTAAGHLGLQIAPGELGHPHVGKEEVAHSLVRVPRVVQLDRRDAHPLLEDADGVAGETARDACPRYPRDVPGRPRRRPALPRW